jgi:hypothetical protein
MTQFVDVKVHYLVINIFLFLFILDQSGRATMIIMKRYWVAVVDLQQKTSKYISNIYKKEKYVLS